MRNIEKIARIIYYSLIPIVIGFYLFGSLGRAKDATDLIQKLVIFLIYIIPLSIIYAWFGDFIFSRLFPEDTLARRLMLKMVNCKIRKERGDGYCVKCPDGYKCAASVDASVDYTNDINKMIKKDKGDVTK